MIRIEKKAIFDKIWLHSAEKRKRKTFCSRFVAMMPIAGVAVVKVSQKKFFSRIEG
jgi:hypothetical protein